MCTALLAASGHLGNIPAPWECEGTAAWPYPLAMACPPAAGPARAHGDAAARGGHGTSILKV